MTRRTRRDRRPLASGFPRGVTLPGTQRSRVIDLSAFGTSSCVSSSKPISSYRSRPLALVVARPSTSRTNLTLLALAVDV